MPFCDKGNSTVKNRAPTVRIGTSKRDPLSKEMISVPGPGAYVPKKMTRSVSVGIGTSLRRPLSESTANPGPGTYPYKDTTNNGPTVKFSKINEFLINNQHVIVPKREDASQNQKDRNTPGPGAYVPNYNVVRLNTPLLK